MIQAISFRGDRSPVPPRVKIGFESDNLVESLAFELPEISGDQSAMLMISGNAYANMIDLRRTEDDKWAVDLTAEMVGPAGVYEGYVAIDCPDGRRWNSGVFGLLTGDLPDISDAIETLYPTAVEHVLQEMSETRQEMAASVTASEDAAQRAEDAAQRAENAANQGGGGEAPAKDAVLYTAQELTEKQKTVARDNIGAASAEAVGKLSEEIETGHLHQAGYLFEPTDGLTDADEFPYNTIYTVTQGANVANIPEKAGGTLITFGSTNPNNGAVQIFHSIYGVMYMRRRVNKAYTEWIRLADDARILAQINSNNNTTVAMKYGALITTAQEAPLNDANTFPVGTVYTVSSSSVIVSNLPSQNGTLMTYNHARSTTAGKCQTFVTNYGFIYSRIYFASAWTAWKMLVTEDKLNAAKTECKAYTDALKINYVDRYVSLSMFEKFGVVGDSYSSGAIYVLNEDGSQKSAGTYYNLSWGQIIARKLGTTCTNFSKGGLSTRTWLTDDKGLPLLLATEPQNIYYLMLGINDKGKHGVEYIGTIADIKTDFAQNADTFYGNYGKIIGNIKTHAPNAKIIMSTMTGKSGANKSFNDAIETIAAHFGIPCVKQYDNDFFNSDFYKNNIVVDHPTAPVYSGMANALQKMFEDAVRDNVAYFNDYVG